MVRIFILIIAILCFLIGIVTLPTPIPLGIIFLGISMALFVMVSETARKLLLRVRMKYQKFNNFLIAAEDYLPGFMVRALQKSTPEQNSLKEPKKPSE